MFTREDFKFVRMIGSGSFGCVHLVQMKVKGQCINKYYALKSLHKRKMLTTRQVNHTNNEKEILTAIRGNPFIVKLMSSFVTPTHVCFLLEYIDGGELFFWLKKMGRFEKHAVKFYAAQVLLALEYLHSKNLIFRDLKPENVLIGLDGYIRITDFGFCKKTIQPTYTVCGTSEYMSPEQLDGGGYGPAVDYWTLGVLIFEMATGSPPYYHTERNHLYGKISSDHVHYPMFLKRDAHLVDFICRLLVKNPRHRLGAKDGFKEIKAHPYWDEFRFDLLLTKQIQALIRPKLRSKGDSMYFCKYDERDSDNNENPNQNPFQDLD